MKKVNELPNHYSTIEDLTLYRWDRYTSTKDNNWFLVDYDGRQSKIDCKELTDVENSIQDQYFKAIDDRSFSNKMQKWAEIDYLKTKYDTCNFLLDELTLTIELEMDPNAKKHLNYLTERRYKIIDQLKKWGLKFPVLNSLVDDLLLMSEFRTVLLGIKTQIGIISNELINDGKKEHTSLLRQLRIVEMSLNYNYRLDPKKITVAEWIEECKLMEEKAKQN